jgi:hypothetical protein
MATTADDVWRLLGELVEAQKETGRSLKETDRILKEQSQETERLFQAVAQESQETERRFQETERRFQETERLFQAVAQESQETERRFQETERLFQAVAQESQETERRFQETERFLQRTAQENRQVNKQLGELGGAWGRFVEDLVAPACERLFVERGIPVDQVSQRVKRRRQGDTLEIDVLVVNQGHVLAVEVKSSLSVEDVREFVADLERFRTFFPEYADMQIYGAVAGIGIESGADRYAYRQGLFVLTQSGESVVLLNDSQFQPKAW